MREREVGGRAEHARHDAGLGLAGDQEHRRARGVERRQRERDARHLRLHPRDACALDGRAWIFATCPNPTYRNGKKAVEVAIEACELTRWKEAYCLETLGAAYAEAGDFASR